MACEHAFDLRDEGETALDFELGINPNSAPSALWIHADGYRNVEHVVDFVLRCGEAFELTGLWGFSWSISCSELCGGAFGGGAQVLDLGKRESVDCIDCNDWLESHLAPSEAPADSRRRYQTDGQSRSCGHECKPVALIGRGSAVLANTPSARKRTAQETQQAYRAVAGPPQGIRPSAARWTPIAPARSGPS